MPNRRKSILLALAMFCAVPLAARADTVPCEDKLAALRAAADTAKLSDADAAKVKELQDKGIERCNADDDKRADDFFDQALAIVGK